MDGTLWDYPCLSIAPRLLDIVEAFHKTGFLLIDVKPENFMRAGPNAWRLVDLGLVEPLHGVSGKRKNDETADMVGTPLYASLAVHNYETPSLRDDVESIAYIVAELVLRVQAGKNTEQFEKGYMIPNYLPWSQEQSDEAIGEGKAKMVKNRKSAFYSSLPTAIADALYKYLQECWSYDFLEKPNYAKLRSCLEGLSIPRKRASKSSGRASRRRKTEEEDIVVDGSDVVDAMEIDEYFSVDEGESVETEPVAVLRVASGPDSGASFPLILGEKVLIGKRPRSRAMNTENWKLDGLTDDKHCLVELAQSKRGLKLKIAAYSNVRIGGRKALAEDVVFGREPIQIGDTELVFSQDKENAKPANVEKPVAAAKPAAKKAVTFDVEPEMDGVAEMEGVMECVLVVVEGPHKGERIPLEQDQPFVLGANPTRKGEPLVFEKDEALKPNHVRLTLSVRRPKKCASLPKLQVLPLDGSVTIGRSKVGKSGHPALEGDRITVGKTVLVVQKV